MADKQDSSRPEYMIKRGFRSSFRLNFNHLLMKEIAGGLVSPKVSLGQDNLRIADVGTGTAAWALETAIKYPRATVDGFDISNKQFSPLYSISNVNLIVHDCFKPFPQQYIGKYDLVHARFWLCSVNNPDAPFLLKNLMTLLKPGGYIQWFEPQVLSIDVWKPDPSMETPFMDQHCRIFKRPREDSTYDWVAQLPETFRSEGLQNVEASEHCIGDQFRAMWLQSNLAGLEDTVSETLVEVGKVEQIRHFSSALQGEIKKGVAINTPFTWVVGQKVI